MRIKILLLCLFIFSCSKPKQHKNKKPIIIEPPLEAKSETSLDTVIFAINKLQYFRQKTFENKNKRFEDSCDKYRLILKKYTKE